MTRENIIEGQSLMMVLIQKPNLESLQRGRNNEQEENSIFLIKYIEKNGQIKRLKKIEFDDQFNLSWHYED